MRLRLQFFNFVSNSYSNNSRFRCLILQRGRFGTLKGADDNKASIGRQRPISWNTSAAALFYIALEFHTLLMREIQGDNNLMNVWHIFSYCMVSSSSLSTLTAL